MIGPGFAEVAAKYADREDVKTYLSGKIRSGGSGTWGPIPMPPQPQLSDEDLKSVVDWLSSGAHH